MGALLLARDGSCWVGGARGLLRFKDARSVETEPGTPALTNLDVSALGLDAQGGLWVGTRQGELWWQDKGLWLAQKKGPRVHAITSIVAAQDGFMWVGTAGDGLFGVEARADGHWRKRTGLLSDWVRTLYQDTENTLWVGTGGGGLSRVQGGKTATFTTREGLPDNTISQILEDDANNLWLGGDRGIVCVRKRELEDLAAQKIPAAYPEVYGRAEGMLSEECISGFFPIGLRTKSGLLWFPTQEGIVVADPHHQEGGNPRRRAWCWRRRAGGWRAWTRRRPCNAGAGQASNRISLHRPQFRRAGTGALSIPAGKFGFRLGGSRVEPVRLVSLCTVWQVPF